MTNFRLLQTERVCRRQFEIQGKWKKVTQMGRKHCGKGEISCFPTMFSKDLYCRQVKTRACLGMVNPFPSKPLVLHNCRTSLENTEGKGEIACYQQFLLFSQCVQPFWRVLWHFN